MKASNKTTNEDGSSPSPCAKRRGKGPGDGGSGNQANREASPCDEGAGGGQGGGSGNQEYRDLGPEPATAEYIAPASTTNQANRDPKAEEQTCNRRMILPTRQPQPTNAPNPPTEESRNRETKELTNEDGGPPCPLRGTSRGKGPGLGGSENQANRNLGPKPVTAEYIAAASTTNEENRDPKADEPSNRRMILPTRQPQPNRATENQPPNSPRTNIPQLRTEHCAPSTQEPPALSTEYRAPRTSQSLLSSYGEYLMPRLKRVRPRGYERPGERRSDHRFQAWLRVVTEPRYAEFEPDVKRYYTGEGVRTAAVTEFEAILTLSLTLNPYIRTEQEDQEPPNLKGSLIPASAAAIYAGVAVKTIHRWIEKGLKHEKKGAYYWISVQSLEQFYENKHKKQKPPSPQRGEGGWGKRGFRELGEQRSRV